MRLLAGIVLWVGDNGALHRTFGYGDPGRLLDGQGLRRRRGLRFRREKPGMVVVEAPTLALVGRGEQVGWLRAGPGLLLADFGSLGIGRCHVFPRLSRWCAYNVLHWATRDKPEFHTE